MSKKYILESRYIGPYRNFSFLDQYREWKNFRKFSTSKSRDQSLDNLSKKPGWWEYRKKDD